MPEPEMTVGRCRVCGGNVVTKHKLQFTSELRVQKRMSKVLKGYHCQDCGIKYEFPPPKPFKSGVILPKKKSKKEPK